MEDYLKNNLSDKRFKHSLGVRDSSIELALKYGFDAEKARIAGLIHDAAKEKTIEELVAIATKNGYILDDVSKSSPSIMHGFASKIIAKEEMGVEDEDILNAIEFHTTGRKNMSPLEKIIYLADYIEPNRNFPGINELREAAYRNLSEALLLSFDNTIKLVISRGNLLHVNTIEARNCIITERE